MRLPLLLQSAYRKSKCRIRPPERATKDDAQMEIVSYTISKDLFSGQWMLIYSLPMNGRKKREYKFFADDRHALINTLKGIARAELIDQVRALISGQAYALRVNMRHSETRQAAAMRAESLLAKAKEYRSLVSLAYFVQDDIVPALVAMSPPQVSVRFRSFSARLAAIQRFTQNIILKHTQRKDEAYLAGLQDRTA